MTAFNYALIRDTLILGACDTQVSDVVDGAIVPVGFATKIAFGCGHACGGTGSAAMLSMAMLSIASPLSQGFISVDDPAFFSELLKSCWNRVPAQGQTSTTVNLFGFAKELNRLIVISFASPDFAPTLKTEYGCYHRPPISSEIYNGLADSSVDYTTSTGLATLVYVQKMVDDSAPQTDKVGIGGEITAWALYRENDETKFIQKSVNFPVQDY